MSITHKKFKDKYRKLHIQINTFQISPIPQKIVSKLRFHYKNAVKAIVIK